MKKIILFLLLFSINCFSQTKQPETNFYLENGKVYWQNIYEVPGKNIDDLIQYFRKEVLTDIKQDNFQIIDNTISFVIDNDKVNFKKYGGTTMGTAIFIQYYYKYLVVIDFKEEKYRVTVKDIFLDNKNIMVRDSGNFEEYITKKKNTEFTTNSIAIKGLQYFHKDFLNKFNINTESKKNDW